MLHYQSNTLLLALFRVLGFPIILVFVVGCTVQRPPLLGSSAHVGAYQGTGDSKAVWQYIKLKFTWPEGHEPLWALDAVVADQVFYKILADRSEKIPLWRFHRRALRDSSGHQFDFIFYCSDECAKQVWDSVVSNSTYLTLKDRSLIEQSSWDSLEMPGGQMLAATSDPTWSKKLQEAWPYFAMGVSATWLELVHSEYSPHSEPSSVKQLLADYRQAEQKVAETWSSSGQHAFFHHLSAMFGYQPLKVTKEIQF